VKGERKRNKDAAID